MIRNFVNTALIAAALLLSAGLSYALDNKKSEPAATEESDATPALAKARAKRAEESKTNAKQKAKERAARAKAEAAAKAKRVDINSAGKEQLKTLSGIGDAEADKIIAGRPYFTKADLVTRNLLSEGNYEPIKRLIVAKQKPGVLPKPGK